MLYVDSYMEIGESRGYISYWHFDITELAKELYGKDFIKEAFIISNNINSVKQTEVETYYERVNDFWKKYHKIYIPIGCCCSITFSNDKKIYFDNNGLSISFLTDKLYKD